MREQTWLKLVEPYLEASSSCTRISLTYQFLVVEHHKIPKISPGVYCCSDLCQRDLLKLLFLLFEFGGASILRRLSTLGNMFGILQ